MIDMAYEREKQMDWIDDRDIWLQDKVEEFVNDMKEKLNETLPTWKSSPYSYEQTANLIKGFL